MRMESELDRACLCCILVNDSADLLVLYTVFLLLERMRIGHVDSRRDHLNATNEAHVQSRVWREKRCD